MRGALKLFLAFSVCLFATFSPAGRRQADKDFNPTLDASEKEGFYVPKDLDDAIAELDKALGPKMKDEIRAKAKEDDMVEYHFGLGMWMRNNWGLWREERLFQSLAKLGLRHPDDMSALILQEYWRHLHSLPYDTDAFIAEVKQSYIENQNPPPHNCPWDQTPVEILMGFGHREVVKGFPGLVSFGRCKHGHLWAWHYKKGWFRPGGALLKEYHDAEAKEKAEHAKS